MATNAHTTVQVEARYDPATQNEQDALVREGTDNEHLRAIVREGVAYQTVRYAEGIGTRLARQLSTSQLRNVFSTVRQIEMAWPAGEPGGRQAQQAQRQLILLKPKLAYQASREAGGGSAMKTLASILSPAIDLVDGDRQRFQHFVDFFEAILAYHTAASEEGRGRR